jgi:hypothetical protein
MVVRCTTTNSVTVRSVYDTETVQSVMSANVRKMTLHMKSRPKCETQAKIQDTQVSSSSTRRASLGLSTFPMYFFRVKPSPPYTQVPPIPSASVGIGIGFILIKYYDVAVPS